MSKTYKLSSGEICAIKMDDYSEDEFVVASMDFLGCNENSHKLVISEKVFRECASTVLGKFVVAEVKGGDATTHTYKERIQGYVPKEQKVRFVRNEDGCLRGVVDVVLSKIYASEFCDIFSANRSGRAVSVEMTVLEEDNGDGSTTVNAFNIMGVTVLGMSVNPSSPGSNISITRFSENNCENYYKSIWKRFEESELDKFVKDRKLKSDGKSYNVNTTELKETAWGDVDKTEIRNAVVNASNKDEIVDKVYLKVEDDWQDAPSEKLKYPVMELDGNTFYYNRFALASALAYAKQHDEADVVSKVEKLYEKFKLAEEGEEENMSEEKFTNREAWEPIVAQVKEHEGEGADVEAVEKDHIIFTVEEVRYRVDANVEVGEEDGVVKADINWDTKAEVEQDKAEDNDAEDKEDDMSDDNEPSDIEEETDDMAQDEKDEEIKEEAAEEEVVEEESEESEESEEEVDYASKIKELEDIIMEKDAELEELRQYKAEREEAEKEFEVQSTLEDVKDCVDAETLEELKKEGMACNLSEISGWKNRAKSVAFDANSGKKKNASMWRMSVPTKSENAPTSKWDNIKL